MVTRLVLVHVARERLHVLDRRRRQDAVSEIEDVARAAGGAAQHVARAGEQAIARAEQQRRIEIALDAAVVADALPRLVERDPPVGADHVAAGLAHHVQDRAGGDAEMNRRHAAADGLRRSSACAAARTRGSRRR